MDFNHSTSPFDIVGGVRHRPTLSLTMCKRDEVAWGEVQEKKKDKILVLGLLGLICCWPGPPGCTRFCHEDVAGFLSPSCCGSALPLQPRRRPGRRQHEHRSPVPSDHLRRVPEEDARPAPGLSRWHHLREPKRQPRQLHLNPIRHPVHPRRPQQLLVIVGALLHPHRRGHLRRAAQRHPPAGLVPPGPVRPALAAQDVRGRSPRELL